MPIYEYRCNSCGAPFEQLRSIRDSDKDVRCPRCESGEVERQLSGFSMSGGSSSSGGCSGKSGRRFT